MRESEVRQYAPSPGDRPGWGAILNSWKEIASYFDRGVRTVQRWEEQLGMPVHRIGTAKRGPVYARVAELKFWMTTSDAAREIKLPPKMEPLRPGTKTD